ncbi:LysM peptidoglycan-binding domain-containing protein [Jatrophihabitans sp.]|uniref:LysM peptidoglycan-binding domain-containing protein n=1 Tax=Jatrophihabitans sp. TaxID=1932789 RepID=UPI002C28AC05|nr:LysM domain-containing protein [Jatrophihabitans sp.]
MSAVDNLNSNQLKYAKGIIAACKARSLPEDQGQRVADIALETALTESGLRMYANAHNPESLRLPHDAVGRDHGSVGLFQQQVGGAVNSTANWGTTAELMDAEISTRKFLDALLRLNWIPMTNWGAAQAVQRSAFRDGSNYRKHDAAAIEIRKALWNGSSSATPARPAAHFVTPAAARQVHTVAPGDTLFSIARAWGVSLQALEAANPNAGHPPGNFDNIRPGDRIVHP